MDKIICLGKNYVEHAKELGDAVPEKPVLFLKPPGVLKSLTNKGDTLDIILPQGKGPVHHECELIFKLNSELAIESVSIGLDLTLRDIQAELKRKGHPWEISKVFSGSAIVGPWISYKEFQALKNEPFSFRLSGVQKQIGFYHQMRMGFEESLHYAKEYFPLYEGDVFFTGTPAGVGPIHPGDLSEIYFGKTLWYKVRFLEQ